MAKNFIDSRVQTDAKAFEELRSAFFEYAQNNFNDVWTDFNTSQFMVLIAELLAYLGDLLTYYLDKQISENFLTTAQLRQSIIDIGRMLDYFLRGPEPATGEVTFTIDAGLFDYNTAIPAGFRISNGTIVYETTDETTVPLGTTQITVGVIEGETFRETQLGDGPLGESDGTPSQQFDLDNLNVILSNTLSDLGDDIQITVDNVIYSPVFNIVTSQSNETVYVVNTDEDGKTSITFGDGIFGAIPPGGATIEATYRALLTERDENNFGNVNAGTITTFVDTRDGLTAVTNSASLSGGRDRESIEEARINIPRSLKSGDRAVSFEDYEFLAENFPGVAKSAALQGEDNLFIDLYIAPEGGGNPSQTLKNELVVYFEGRKMIGTKIFPRDPIFQPVSINIRTQASPNNKNSDIKTAQETALSELFSFDNLDFGQGVFLKSTGGNDLFDINESLESVDGAALIKYNKITMRPTIYNKKFTNSGTMEMLDACCSTRQGAKRREFEIEMENTSQFKLKNKIFGRSTSLNDTRLEDSLKSFLLEDGTSTFVDTNLLQDSSRFFQVDEFKFQTLIDSAGTQFEIQSNTRDTFTLDGTPAAGDYQIVTRLVGRLLNPNTEQSQTFLITSNDANSVTVVSGLSTVSTINDQYEIIRYESNKFNGQEGTETSGTATSTTFTDITKIGFGDDFFNGQMVIFQSGSAANIPVTVIDFISASGTFTVESLGVGIAPASGDRYVVAPFFELGLSDVVSSAPTPTTSQFSGDTLGNEGSDFYNGYTLLFTSGNNNGVTRRVIDYDDSLDDTLTTNPFDQAPAVGDSFKMAREYSIDDETITFSAIGDNVSSSDIYLFQSSELVGDLTPRENQILVLNAEDINIIVVGGS